MSSLRGPTKNYTHPTHIHSMATPFGFTGQHLDMLQFLQEDYYFKGITADRIS